MIIIRKYVSDVKSMKLISQDEHCISVSDVMKKRQCKASTHDFQTDMSECIVWNVTLVFGRNLCFIHEYGSVIDEYSFDLSWTIVIVTDNIIYSL